LEGSKAAEELALERAEIEAEMQSSASLESQVTLLSKQLEDAGALGLSTAELYASMVGQFGGITPTLPEEPLAYNLFVGRSLTSPSCPILLVEQWILLR
jgi:hypothetical protein